MSQVVLITGCSSGLGKLAAEILASQGYIVYAGIRKLADGKRLGEAWKASYPTMQVVKLDITKDGDCQKAVKKIIQQEGRIDVLINNAGISLAGPSLEFKTQDYLNILNINAAGAFRLIKEVTSPMKKRRSGKIINITSLNGLLALPNFGLYSSSKFALEALGLSLRYELAKYNIWVTNVAPGAVASKKSNGAKKIPHTPARERFLILKLLMPMVTQEKIIQEIEKIIEVPHPPARVILGRDAQITIILQRLLPSLIWDRLLYFVWSRQSEK